jgi:molybdenum cofactor synthesis domain-containing protein
MESIRTAVITVSDGVSAGTREDSGGAAVCAWVRGRGSALTAHVVVADVTHDIATAIRTQVDDGGADLVITTGGTGLTARDVTPEATRSVIEREVPGIGERMRRIGTAQTPYATLSRGVAGTRGGALIVNLPGSMGGVRDGLSVLDEIVDHAVQLLRGIDTDRHDSPGSTADG